MMLLESLTIFLKKTRPLAFLIGLYKVQVVLMQIIHSNTTNEIKEIALEKEIPTDTSIGSLMHHCLNK